jgi:amidohydrolase
MHACGHDSHTAILLTVAKILKAREADLPCNVRLFFQPSEEGAISGAKMMVENGCLEGVDAVICLHCEESIPSGSVGVQWGECMAACVPMCLKFHGITSHATLPHAGVDAIAMAVESYGALKAMVKEEAGDRPYIWSVGVFNGGEVHNVIADLCTQYISFRFYDEEFAQRVHDRTEQIIREIAARYGGRAELEWHMSCPPVNNDAALVAHLEKVVASMSGVEMVVMPAKRSSEDFSWFTAQRPGMLFRYGIHNEAKGCVHAAHRPDFMVDEEAMKVAVLAFVNYVLTYQG